MSIRLESYMSEGVWYIFFVIVETSGLPLAYLAVRKIGTGGEPIA